MLMFQPLEGFAPPSKDDLCVSWLTTGSMSSVHNWNYAGDEFRRNSYLTVLGFGHYDGGEAHDENVKQRDGPRLRQQHNGRLLCFQPNSTAEIRKVSG
jgi:hypothetical protein